MENWYAPGPVHCRKMTDEERQYYQKERQKRQYPWRTKQGQRELNGRQWGKHRSSVFRSKRKVDFNGY